MLCEKCGKKEATFYYHENVNGNEKSLHLCADCAAETEKKGGFGQSGAWDGLDFLLGDNMLADPFKSMNSILAGFLGGSKQLSEKRCPDCNLSFKELASSGMAGCPSCYETFGKELEGTVHKLHGRTIHNGRVPARFRAKMEMKNRIEALEEEQKEAVRTENYERAAQIRDELRKLRGPENEA